MQAIHLELLPQFWAKHKLWEALADKALASVQLIQHFEPFFARRDLDGKGREIHGMDLVLYSRVNRFRIGLILEYTEYTMFPDEKTVALLLSMVHTLSTTWIVISHRPGWLHITG